jgi:hypothetical protein
MNDSLAVNLGELQAQIYWLHDAEKFTELAEIAAQVYQCLEAETHLGLSESIAEHQMKWWLYFRHKQTLKVGLHLFLQHFKSLGWINLIPAIQVTYDLVKIGKIHKLRDLEMTAHYASHYWSILLKIKPPQYPYLG